MAPPFSSTSCDGPCCLLARSRARLHARSLARSLARFRDEPARLSSCALARACCFGLRSASCALTRSLLRRWLKKHYSEEGTDHVRPVRAWLQCDTCLLYLTHLARFSFCCHSSGSTPTWAAWATRLVLRCRTSTSWAACLRMSGRSAWRRAPSATCACCASRTWTRRTASSATRAPSGSRRVLAVLLASKPPWSQSRALQLLHRGDPAEHRHPHDANLLYHPHPADDESKR